MYVSILSYIALLLTGSFIGYYKAGSIVSLLAGIVSSLLLGGFAYFNYLKRRWARPCLLLTVVALDTFFSTKFIKSPSFFPAGLFVILSSTLLIILYLNAKKLK